MIRLGDFNLLEGTQPEDQEHLLQLSSNQNQSELSPDQYAHEDIQEVDEEECQSVSSETDGGADAIYAPIEG